MTSEAPQAASRQPRGYHRTGHPADPRPAGKRIGVLARSWHVEQQAEFAEFYRSSREDCLRIVWVNVGDRELAEDLVAEGFSRAWASWPKVRQHPAPRAWVVRTALNAHVSWWRRRRREVALESAVDAPRPTLAGRRAASSPPSQHGTMK